MVLPPAAVNFFWIAIDVPVSSEVMMPDLRTGRDALLGLRKLLLRVVQRVHDRGLDARLLERVDERRLVELLPPDRRLRVRQKDAY